MPGKRVSEERRGAGRLSGCVQGRSLSPLPYGSDPIHSACDPVQLVAETKTENKIKILT